MVCKHFSSCEKCQSSQLDCLTYTIHYEISVSDFKSGVTKDMTGYGKLFQKHILQFKKSFLFVNKVITWYTLGSTGRDRVHNVLLSISSFNSQFLSTYFSKLSVPNQACICFGNIQNNPNLCLAAIFSILVISKCTLFENHHDILHYWQPTVHSIKW